MEPSRKLFLGILITGILVGTTIFTLSEGNTNFFSGNILQSITSSSTGIDTDIDFDIDNTITNPPDLTFIQNPNITSHSDGEPNVEIDRSIEWDSVPNATKYQASLYETDLGPASCNIICSEEIMAPSTGILLDSIIHLDYNTNYTFVLHAYNEAGETTTTVITFTTENDPSIAMAPIFINPTSGLTDVSINTTLAWMPDYVDSYRIDLIPKNNPENCVVCNQELPYDTMYHGTYLLHGDQTLEYNTVYRLTVTAIIDSKGASNTVEFTTESNPALENLTAPIITSHTQDATDVEIDRDIEWNQINAATFYDVTMYNDRGFEVWSNDSIGDYFIRVSGSKTLDYSTTYNLSVSAVLMSGSTEIGRETTTVRFTTEEDPDPAPEHSINLNVLTQNTVPASDGILNVLQSQCTGLEETFPSNTPQPQHSKCNNIEFDFNMENFSSQLVYVLITYLDDDGTRQLANYYKFQNQSDQHIERITWDALSCGFYGLGTGMNYSRHDQIECPTGKLYKIQVYGFSETAGQLKAEEVFYISE